MVTVLSKEKTIRIAFVVVCLQVLFFIFWALGEEGAFDGDNVKYILVETRPVDPRSLISGNYFILNYRIDSPGNYENFNKEDFSYDKKNKTVYALLKKEEGGNIHSPYKLSFKPFSLEEIAEVEGLDGVAVKGIFKHSGFIDFSIGRYFINEEMKEPSRADQVTVELKIRPNHKAQIEKVFVDGVEYFSTQK